MCAATIRVASAATVREVSDDLARQGPLGRLLPRRRHQPRRLLPRQVRGTGPLAASLGLHGSVDETAFRAILDGRHPTTGEPFADTQRRVAAHDFTFSLQKSFGIYWALGTPEQRAAVEGALSEGVRSALGYLEQTACHVRRGHAGAEVLDGNGFLAASFFHPTSRAGDPGPHCHVVVANLTTGPDGRTTALDARPIFKERYTADAVFQAVARRHLARTVGTLFNEPNQHGVAEIAEIADISDDALRAFSKRRTQVLDEMRHRGTHTPRRADRCATSLAMSCT